MIDRILQVGNWTKGSKRDNPQRGRIYDPRGISPALTCMGGGNLQPFVILYESDGRTAPTINESEITKNEPEL